MRSKFLIIAGIFIAGLCFLTGFLLTGKVIKKKWIIHKTLRSTHWQQRIEEMAALAPGKYKAIFLGNSLTELFDLREYFKDSTILNCGIVGDFSEGLLKRCNTIVRLKPEKLFIEIGINDIVEQVPLDEICANYEALIDSVQKRSPATKIYVQSNLPLIIRRNGFFIGNEGINELVREQNKNLKKLAAQKEVEFIDLYTPFLRSGRLEDLLVGDGVHLTSKAYTTWKMSVMPYLYPASER